MYAPVNSNTAENVAKAQRILAMSEVEQRSFFLSTMSGQYAKNASPRGMALRFRSWVRYLRGVVESAGVEA